MNNIKYQQILYFISIVILLTLCVQGYWSYKNYLSEKRQLITDVQVSLDNAVDSYYTQLAKKNTLAYITDSIPSDSIFMGIRLADLIPKEDSLHKQFDKVTGLTSEAEKARDYLMRLPDRMYRLAERAVIPDTAYQFKWMSKM